MDSIIPPAVTAEDGLRELIPRLRRYRGAPNILFGEPGDLSRLCRIFGFRNDCRRGRVYITPAKIQRLEALGLPPATEPPPDDIHNSPTSLEEAHAEARADREAFFEPPPGSYVPVAQMPSPARAYAVLLALKAGWRVNPCDWSWCEATGYVLVAVPSVGRTWGRLVWGRDEILAAIGERYGELARGGAEEAVGG